MKTYLLCGFFLLVLVEVVNGVVYSWILNVNPVDTGEKRDTAGQNNTNKNSSLQEVSIDEGGAIVVARSTVIAFRLTP